ncbi:MAG: hypothetical protein ACFFCO_06810 [Promethearchaeota archaeon]
MERWVKILLIAFVIIIIISVVAVILWFVFVVFILGASQGWLPGEIFQTVANILGTLK